MIFVQENVIKNGVWKLTSILSQPQYAMLHLDGLVLKKLNSLQPSDAI